MERYNSEDLSWQPLIPVTASSSKVPHGSAMASDEARVVEEAVAIVRDMLDEMRRSQGRLTCADTAELLRNTCQLLADLGTGLEQMWQQTHPGEQMPSWAVEAVPEEEFARIGWDFQANRVQMKGSNSGFWQAFGYLIAGDQSASFAPPPSAPQVEEALARVATRLGGDAVSCH